MPLVLGWLLLAGPVWGAVGAAAVPRRYRSKGADPRLAGAAGALVGLAAGLPALLPLWLRVPPLRRWWAMAVPSLLLGAELVAAFAVTQPGNACVRGPGYLATQLGTGLLVGAVLATAAVGLTLVYSVLGVVSFAHGQFVMAGGVTAFLLLTQVWPVNPLLVVPVVALAGFGLGVLVDTTLLTPLHRGRVHRRDEYAVLVTFGLGVFMQYGLLGVLGPTSGLRAPRYTDRPLFGLSAGRLAGLDTNLLVAGAVGVLLCAGLTLFLRFTWWGRSLRAVSQNPQAASVAGVDAGRTATVAFGLGAMLAAAAGAALVPVLNFPVPDVAGQMALRSYVIVVLGGLGSVPGAFLGGLFIGVVEALGAGCYPDPSKGAVYQSAFGLLIFAAVLLARPRGFFGRVAP